MLEVAPPDGVEALVARARANAPGAALLAFTQFVTGRAGYPAYGGHALHAVSNDLEIRDLTAPDCPMQPVETFEDGGLDSFDLALSVTGPAVSPLPRPPLLEAGVVALRLGLLARCLDTAFSHLEGRESFGKKILHHQLVKVGFARVHAAIARMVEELVLAGPELDPATAAVMHRSIGGQFTEAAKLMGGHGYLAGSAHNLEYLAGLILAVYAPAGRSPAGSMP
ncbi:acyl-CoA dehydrogenase family protein [Azospirillum sp. TSH100]|uniref:acyl-CoA dehydrogenase family protein n=1 Tax=unclassified Azospirillum TaxID=2630922 RepID=UPI000D6506E0|nr:acyl-CoA dehydrogenase family protein [Azospirillum sp. TSH100]